MEIGKTGFGLLEPNKMVPCALTKPDDERDRPLYELFVNAGRPYVGDKNWSSYIPYYSCVSSTGHMACVYLGDACEDGIAWQVPEWSLALAHEIRSFIRDAESIGREEGFNDGLATGKSFVMQLAKGDLKPNSFLDADPRDDRRLTRKSW